MLKAKVLGSYVNKAYKYMRRIYIEQGYFTSGSIDMNDIYTKIHSDKEKAEIIVDQLLESGKVQIRRNCLGLAFELSVEERSELIREHNLAEVWEENAPEYAANDSNGEIFLVIKEMKRKEMKLTPKHYTSTVKQEPKKVVSEQLSFELQAV